jgi:chorismate mutase/prephenate dehydratase
VLFGLEILADEIGDAPGNRTRFIVIRQAAGGGGYDVEGPWRTTLAFGVRNEPGALLRALAVFAGRTVNLSRLESRPSRERAWEYVFLTDVDGAAGSTDVAAALDHLRAETTFVRVLGSYRRAPDAPAG